MNRKKFLTLSSMAALALTLPAACKKSDLSEASDGSELNTDSQTQALIFSKFKTDKGAYSLNETVKVSFEVKNNTPASITLTELHVFLKDIANPGATFSLRVDIANDITIAPSQSYTVTSFAVWTVPGYALFSAFGIYVGASIQGGQPVADTYATFFRVVEQAQLLCYHIENNLHEGLNVHLLDGGLSAEYLVEKSAENLSPGVAHSWKTSRPGFGPNSVVSTENFLERSIDYTVEYYNETLGRATIFDTVIISTGVCSVPYLSQVMKAPVLPLHFLVSATTIKEIIAILNYNKEVKGYSTYATLGYDGSIDMAVAWIKMLELPQPYIDFLNQHHVRNVVIAGTYGETFGGEGKARKVIYNSNPNTGYNNGDLFLMYPQGGIQDDFNNLYNKLRDLVDYNASLESNYRTISDWESGLVTPQISNFSNAIKANTSVEQLRRVSALDTLHMYDLATYLALNFMKKNNAVFTADGPAVAGVAMNPYMLSHPGYESKIKYIPMLFWQGNSGPGTVDRLLNTIKPAIASYFPDINFNSLNFWVNTSKNFGGFQANNIKTALQTSGLTSITMNNNEQDEVWSWNTVNDTISNNIADNILTYSTALLYRDWFNNLSYLTPADLDGLPARHPDISVVTL